LGEAIAKPNIIKTLLNFLASTQDTFFYYRDFALHNFGKDKISYYRYIQ